MRCCGCGEEEEKDIAAVSEYCHEWLVTCSLRYMRMLYVPLQVSLSF